MRPTPACTSARRCTTRPPPTSRRGRQRRRSSGRPEAETAGRQTAGSPGSPGGIGGGVDERIVVVGGSAGSLGALIEVLAGAPQLAAPVLIAVHMAAGARTSLPSILRRATGHDVRLAAHLEPLEPGTVLVCPPDRHMRAGRLRVHLSTGPRENHVRPAVDPLFRSAARSHGAGAIAVVLSGMLDDGAAGMLAVRQAGGYGIVQDRRGALYGGMPSAAVAVAGV